MKKRLMFLVLILLAILALPFPAYAAETLIAPVQKPIASPVPIPLCRDVDVSSNEPLRLKGTGTLIAKGNGHVHFQVENGRVRFNGKGVVAVKTSDNDTVTVSGIGKKLEIGPWVIYIGEGTLTVRGDDYEVIGKGKFTIHASGTGSAMFHGHWHVRFCHLLPAEAVPIPDVIPHELEESL